MAVVLLLLVSGWALAGPAGTRVVRGKAQIEQSGDTWVIRAANRTILAFDRFDIAPGQTVRFILPNRRARVLGRVEGGRRSLIAGVLDCNGRLVLTNPAGITLSPNALVTAGAFTACAGRLSDRDFLRGADHFRDLSASVVNDGTIRADQAAVLVGQLVENAGTIICPQGLVVLAGGGDVCLATETDNIVARIDPAKLAPAAPAPDLAAPAPGPRIGTRDTVSLVVHNTGQVRARAIVADAGPAGAAEISGRLDASSLIGRGGAITVSGGSVALVGALLDASGPAGGGTIAIGRSDASPSVSRLTTLNAATVLLADATANGDGGRIALWGDVAAIDASLAARGAGSGRGGWVETSALTLARVAPPDTSSPSGRAGAWRLDPTSILITDNGLTPLPPPTDIALFESSPDNTVLYAESIAAAFAQVDTIVVRTGHGPGKGDITWESRLPFDVSTWGGHSKQIVLIADRDIVFTQRPADWGTLQGLRLTLVPDADHNGAGRTVIDLLDEFSPETIRGNPEVWRTRPLPVEPDSPLEVAVVRAQSGSARGTTNAEAEKYWAMGDYSRAKDKYQQDLPAEQATSAPASQPTSAPAIRAGDRAILAVPTLIGP